MGLFGRKKEEKSSEESTQEKEEEQEKETYEKTKECENCGEETTVHIPCGTRFNDFIKGKKCSSCKAC